MALRIAINGFGRIGRNVLRSAWNDSSIEFVHINDLTSDDMLAHLLRNDSVHGPFRHDVKAVDGGISIDGKVIPTTAERDPSALPWKRAEVDVVLECTGVFTDGARAGAHISAGARKVVISAPGKGIDGTFVMGVNDDQIDPSKHHIVSNASCTTNCLAPTTKVLDDLVGVESGLITTVHSYTMDQNLLDAPHPGGKFRRARAAALNMVPTSTGAAKAIGLVMPHLAGKLDGMAIRVPTPNGSLVDATYIVKADITVEAVNAAYREAANGALAGILEANSDLLVSSDIIGNPHSAIIDLPLTAVNGRQVKVLSWYDNEWGFSNRMLSLAKRIGA